MWSLCWWLAVPAGARRAGRRLFPVGADVPAGGQGGQGLGEGAGQRDLPVQAGEREYPPDLVPAGHHVRAAAAGGGLPGRAGEHAQPGHVDERDPGQVRDHGAAAGGQQRKLAAQLRHGGDVDLAGHRDQHVRDVVPHRYGQRLVHGPLTAFHRPGPGWRPGRSTGRASSARAGAARHHLLAVLPR